MCQVFYLRETVAQTLIPPLWLLLIQPILFRSVRFFAPADSRFQNVKIPRIAEMASLPLWKVRAMKEKLGLKLFNRAYFGNEQGVEEQQAEGGAKKEFKVR